MAERMRVTSFIAVSRRGPTVPRRRWAPEPRRSDRLAARPGTAWSPQDYPRGMRGDRPAHRFIGARSAPERALPTGLSSYVFAQSLEDNRRLDDRGPRASAPVDPIRVDSKVQFEPSTPRAA